VALFFAEELPFLGIEYLVSAKDMLAGLSGKVMIFLDI